MIVGFKLNTNFLARHFFPPFFDTPFTRFRVCPFLWIHATSGARRPIFGPGPRKLPGFADAGNLPLLPYSVHIRIQRLIEYTLTHQKMQGFFCLTSHFSRLIFLLKNTGILFSFIILPQISLPSSPFFYLFNNSISLPSPSQSTFIFLCTLCLSPLLNIRPIHILFFLFWKCFLYKRDPFRYFLLYIPFKPLSKSYSLSLFISSPITIFIYTHRPIPISFSHILFPLISYTISFCL